MITRLSLARLCVLALTLTFALASSAPSAWAASTDVKGAQKLAHSTPKTPAHTAAAKKKADTVSKRNKAARANAQHAKAPHAGKAQ